MRTLSVALSLSALAGVSAFVASPFMGSKLATPSVATDAKMTMVFGIGGSKKAGGKSSVKAAKKPAASKAASSGPNYLRQPQPGSGTLGQWYVREDPTLSTALPWITKPEIGDGTLVGDFGFDPFGLAKIFDVNFLRSAELKHGRLAMLAALGLVTPELVQKPVGFEGFHFAPEFSELNAIKALSTVPKLGIAQIVLVIAFAEIATFGRVYNERYTFEDNLTPLERKKVLQGKFGDLSGAAKTQGKAGVNAFGEAVDVGFQDPDQKILPGDLGFDPLGFADNGVNPNYALSEIKHARLAMIGALGMLAQEFAQDKGILQQTINWANGQ